MNKARKRFVGFALLALFAVLGMLQGIINGINFTMAADDADRITQMLAEGRGAFPAALEQQRIRDRRMGPMGPDSPEMAFSVRYFAFAFDGEGNAERLAWSISAVDEEEARAWAESLSGERETGWTRMTYRYRVYRQNGRTVVIVIDQGREMLPSYRILLISGLGLAAGMLVCWAALLFAGRKVFQPLEEADRRQKRFIAEVEKEFKLPLTVMSANVELIERAGGETEQTRSIGRQVRRMAELVKDLGSMGLFEESDLSRSRVDLAALAQAAADAARPGFEEDGRAFTLNAAPGIWLEGDAEALGDLLAELLENARKFASTWARLEIGQSGGRVRIAAANDTSLPAGQCDEVFDRFTRLANAAGAPGHGLGLAHAKDIARAHNGRVSAAVENGVFTVQISL